MIDSDSVRTQIATWQQRWPHLALVALEAHPTTVQALGATKVDGLPLEAAPWMESGSVHWRKMWCLFQLKAEEFQRSYHRRSNVESTIGSIKARCGGLVRSKTAAAQCNEVLAKVLIHNLACLVHAIEKYGIGVTFPFGAKS